MNCDAIRQLLLSLDLDEKSRQLVSEALAHLGSCEACRHAMKDFDELAKVLRTGTQSNESPTFLEASEDEHSLGDASLIPDVSLLRHDANVSPPGGWKTFESKLLAVIREPSRQRSFLSRGRPWLPYVASLAAMLLVAWAAFHAGKRAPGVRGPPIAAQTGAECRLSPDEVAQKVRAFGAIDQSFDGQTRWLMLSANNTDVELVQYPGQAVPTTRDPGAKILLVRLNLVRGAEVVSQADMLIVAGTTANVVVPTKLGVPLQYRITTSARDPMRLSVQLLVPGQGNDRKTASSASGPSGSELAVLGTSLELQPYIDATAGRLVLGRQSFDLQVAAAASNLPG